MALGYEWLIVAAVVIIIFLWGPQKLPQLARSLGLAKKEFEKSKNEISSPSPSLQSVPTDSLIIAAREMGVATEGKTKEQIAKEIADKASSSNS